MDKLETMQIFVEVAKHQSFVAASEAMNISAPKATRAIADLESRLGTKLFNRTTRLVRLTEAGAQFLANVKRILEDIDEAETEAAGSQSAPKGTLTVTAPVLFGEKHVIPIITEYLSRYPEVSVRALFTDQVSNLVEEELDVAIRIGHLKDSSLYATKVGDVRRIVCGSADYFRTHGEPKHPEELEDHTIIFPMTYDSVPAWHFIADGKKISVKLNPRLRCSQNSGAIKAAVNGFGITRQMSYQIGEELAQGRLQAVLTGYEEPALPVNLIRLDGRRSQAKIRKFLNLATKRLRENRFVSL